MEAAQRVGREPAQIIGSLDGKQLLPEGTRSLLHLPLAVEGPGDELGEVAEAR